MGVWPKHNPRYVHLRSGEAPLSVGLLRVAVCLLKLGFNSLGPYHMSRGHWWSDICHTCKDCKPNAYKEGMMTAWASELKACYFS